MNKDGTKLVHKFPRNLPAISQFSKNKVWEVPVIICILHVSVSMFCFKTYFSFFFQKEKFNENIEEMLTKLEEFCGLVDMVILKQGNFHFIMKSIINIFSVDSIISTE